MVNNRLALPPKVLIKHNLTAFQAILRALKFSFFKYNNVYNLVCLLCMYFKARSIHLYHYYHTPMLTYTQHNKLQIYSDFPLKFLIHICERGGAKHHRVSSITILTEISFPPNLSNRKKYLFLSMLPTDILKQQFLII